MRLTPILLLAGLILLLLLPAPAEAKLPLPPAYAAHLLERKLKTLYPTTISSASVRCHRLTLYSAECDYLAVTDPGRTGFEIGLYGEAVGCYRGDGSVRKFYPGAAATYSVRASRPEAVVVHSISELTRACLTFLGSQTG